MAGHSNLEKKRQRWPHLFSLLETDGSNNQHLFTAIERIMKKPDNDFDLRDVDQVPVRQKWPMPLNISQKWKLKMNGYEFLCFYLMANMLCDGTIISFYMFLWGDGHQQNNFLWVIIKILNNLIWLSLLYKEIYLYINIIDWIISVYKIIK